MIIFDYNQVAIANIMEQIGPSKDAVEEGLVRHMILNTIRSCVKKFKSEYGSEVVIACDDRNYWRRELFPYYKAKRKLDRETSGHDWSSIFECLQKVKEELAEYSHYRVIQVDTAEADDIIAVLAMKYHTHQKVMIVSGDKDFIQLQQYKNVAQYSPITKKFIEDKSPKEQLKRLIIKGDSGDGIPNILSPDNCLVEGVRQKPIMEAKLCNWVNQAPSQFCDTIALRNYSRNEQLIDLSTIPKKIVESIIYTFDDTKPKTKMQFMNYLVSKRLTNLIEVANEF